MSELLPLRVKICTDKSTGQSRGVGFLNYASVKGAAEALDALNGMELGDKHIEVSWATS